jgi:transposase
MWTAKNRARYNRDQLRYPSDVTEAEWAVIAPLIPPARRGGAQADGQYPGSVQRRTLYFEHRLSVAGHSHRAAAAQYDL